MNDGMSTLQKLQLLLEAEGANAVVAIQMLPRAIDEVEAWAREQLAQLDVVEGALDNEEQWQKGLEVARDYFVGNGVLTERVNLMQELLDNPEVSRQMITLARAQFKALLGEVS